MSLRDLRQRTGWVPPDFFLEGDLDAVPRVDRVMFRVRLFELLGALVRDHNVGPFSITAGYPAPSPDGHGPRRESGGGQSGEEVTGPSLSPVPPSYTFQQLVLPARTIDQLLDYVALIEVAPTVFDTWNLRSVEPNPSTAVNFRGPPGTGKTLAAHAIAHRLGRPILLSRLSDLESKYHGDGPKNLVQLFASARRAGAVLFIDEAESLLSRRFAQPGQAAESAINSMRTELLMALDAYEGLVIFASNLPHSYDQAIESRLLHIDFSPPDRATRAEIWRRHLPAALPLSPDVSIEALAGIEGLTGRDIKTAVISAAVSAARRREESITQQRLVSAALRQKSAEDDKTVNRQLTSAEAGAVADVVGELLPRP